MQTDILSECGSTGCYVTLSTHWNLWLFDCGFSALTMDHSVILLPVYFRRPCFDCMHDGGEYRKAVSRPQSLN